MSSGLFLRPLISCLHYKPVSEPDPRSDLAPLAAPWQTMHPQSEDFCMICFQFLDDFRRGEELSWYYFALFETIPDPQIDPSTNIGTEIDPSTDVKIKAEIDPSTNINTEVDPSTDINPQIDPSTDINTQIDPSTNIDPQIDPPFKINPRIDPSKLRYPNTVVLKIELIKIAMSIARQTRQVPEGSDY